MNTKRYLITYSLKTPNWNYSGFFGAIQGMGTWWHYIDSTWILKNTSYTNAQQIYTRLAPFLSKNDFILVVEIVPGTSFGWLPKAAWDWINS